MAFRRRSRSLSSDDVLTRTFLQVRQNAPVTEFLSSSVWRTKAAAHRELTQHITSAVRERSRAGKKHPIEDFLWTYYSFKPAQFERWHPGFGIALEDADEYADVRGYVFNSGVATVDPAFIERRKESLLWIRNLLQQTAARPAQFGCFGLHEWAMVYRREQNEVRHEQAPLRLSTAEIAAVVESQELKCTHFDAFRFYVPEARSLNHMLLTRESQIDLEQPGCLHANMDIYKWAYKCLPMISSDFLVRAFELAKDIRLLDMRAAPYDLSEWGFSPVAIETVEGKAEYVRQQREFSARAANLRNELLTSLNTIIAAAS